MYKKFIYTDYTVSYSNNINIGLSKVTILGIGKYEGKVEKTFNIKDKEKIDISSLTIKNIKDQTYTGIKITPDVEVTENGKKLQQNVDYELNYRNNINVGTATIIIKGIGNYKAEATKTFKINAKNIALVTVEDIPKQIHTGKEIKPNIIITDNSARLEENKDYEINLTNNIEVGQATITITGKGNYSGQTVKKFEIIADKQDENKTIEKLTITDIDKKIYTGKLITPEVRITDGDKVLIKDVDYKINYINNINIGTATAIIEGIGEYKGTVKKNFKIIRKNIVFTTIDDISNQEYTGKEITPKVKITSDFIELEIGKDYEIKYINNINEGKATIKITGKGNYEGETVKTFNIIKIEENKETEVPNQEKDDTDINKNIVDNTLAQNLPYTGTKFITVFIVILSVGIIFGYKKYSQYKDI